MWPSPEGLVPGTGRGGAEHCASSPETGELVFNPLLTCCVTRASCFTSLGLGACLSSMGQVYVRREGGEGCDLTDYRGHASVKT